MKFIVHYQPGDKAEGVIRHSVSDVSEEFTCDDWVKDKSVIYLLAGKDAMIPWSDRVIHIISLYNIRRIRIVRE